MIYLYRFLTFVFFPFFIIIIYFRKFIKVKDPDIILFPFKISDLQKTQLNSHTTIEIVKNKLKSINVKKFTNVKLYGEKPNTVIAPSKKGIKIITKNLLSSKLLKFFYPYY